MPGHMSVATAGGGSLQHYMSGHYGATIGIYLWRTTMPNDIGYLMIGIVAGAVFWLVGRATRYVFAAE